MECATAVTEGVGGRLLLLLSLVISVALLAALGVLVYDRVARSAGLPPAAGWAGSRVTARQAHAPAAELAGQWERDAGLAAVSGQWSAVGLEPEGQVEWTFHFFSSSTQRLALIAVADGVARVVRESESPYPVPTFSAGDWRVDSDGALWTWWRHGGEELVAQHPDADVAMQLRVSEGEDGRLDWTVVGLAGSTEDPLVVVLSGADGALVGP